MAQPVESHFGFNKVYIDKKLDTFDFNSEWKWKFIAFWSIWDFKTVILWRSLRFASIAASHLFGNFFLLKWYTYIFLALSHAIFSNCLYESHWNFIDWISINMNNQQRTMAMDRIHKEIKACFINNFIISDVNWCLKREEKK